MKNKKVWSLALLSLSCVALLGCAAKVTDTNVPDVVKRIYEDQAEYAALWTRWTITDWVLTLFAAGTAISAAVKNAFTSHTQSQGGGDGTGSPPSNSTSAKVDRWVMVLAALTIIATTLDAKMQAGQKAVQYRAGDLLLQDAIMDYRGSKGTEADQDTLLNAWHQAQKILEGGTVSLKPAPKPSTSSATGSPAQPAVDNAGKPAQPPSAPATNPQQPQTQTHPAPAK